MLTGSRRRCRRCRSGFGEEAIEIVSAFPFRLLTEGFPVITDAVELHESKKGSKNNRTNECKINGLQIEHEINRKNKRIIPWNLFANTDFRFNGL